MIQNNLNKLNSKVDDLHLNLNLIWIKDVIYLELTNKLKLELKSNLTLHNFRFILYKYNEINLLNWIFSLAWSYKYSYYFLKI